MCKKILTNEEWNRLIKAYQCMRKARTLAETYNVSGNDLQKITRTIIEEPDITLQEIIDKLHLDCTFPSLRRKT